MSQSNIKIRQAIPDDAAGIYDVHASNDESGEWRDVAECREQIEWMIGRGTPPIVAESDDKIIGEMKIWWGQDVPELGRSLDISTLYVHRNHQHRGVGSALIGHAVKGSKEKDCDCVSVWADRNATGFYQKQGFERQLLLDKFSVDTTSAEAAEAFRFQSITLNKLDLPNGGYLQTQRILHPHQRWHGLVWQETKPPPWKDNDERRPAIFPYLVTLSGGDEADKRRASAIAVYRLSYWRGDSESAELYLWSPIREQSVLLACIAHAGKMGIRMLSILAYGEIAAWLTALGSEVRGEEQVLVRQNRS